MILIIPIEKFNITKFIKSRGRDTGRIYHFKFDLTLMDKNRVGSADIDCIQEILGYPYYKFDYICDEDIPMETYEKILTLFKEINVNSIPRQKIKDQYSSTIILYDKEDKSLIFLSWDKIFL